MKWYSFPVSGFQLRDILDSLVARDSSLLYNSFRMSTNQYFSVYIVSGKDTVACILHISGNSRTWLERPDSSYLALMDIRRDVPLSDSFIKINNRDTLTIIEKEKFQNTFISKVIEPIRSDLIKSDLYSIRPLNIKDTLNAQWIVCKGKFNTLCDTFWLTSKDGAEWVLSDTNIFVRFK
jgi:hypothetical protein